MDRSHLLNDIRRIFIRHGYEGASLSLLAQGTGLSKASLYHHYPGGKLEMGQRLLEDAISDLERRAFKHLLSTGNADKALRRFIGGFIDYVQAHDGCLLCVFGMTAPGSDAASTLNQTVRDQLKDWHNTLTATLMRQDMKPKKAERRAHQLLAALWGALLVSQLSGDRSLFKTLAERELRAAQG